MTSAFSRFPPRLQAAIASHLGWTSLRPGYCWRIQKSVDSGDRETLP